MTQRPTHTLRLVSCAETARAAGVEAAATERRKRPRAPLEAQFMTTFVAQIIGQRTGPVTAARTLPAEPATDACTPRRVDRRA